MIVSTTRNNPHKDHFVAVTGVGMICPLGVTASACWENLLAGRSGIGRIRKFDVSECFTQIGGELPEEYFELEKKKTSKRLFKQTVRATRITRLCAQEAVADSDLDVNILEPMRCGVIIGTSGSSVRSPDDLGGPGTEKFKIIREMTNALPAWVSLDHHFKGPSFAVSAGSASGSYAIARAYDLIRWGLADLVIAGGVDSVLSKNNIQHGNAMQLLSGQNDRPDQAMRPFDRKRSGFVLSDGGCAVVLESSEHAAKRNARVYGWMVGYGSRFEPVNLHAPRAYAEGMARAIESALANAHVTKKRIGHVSAHGQSTVVSDLCETMALKEVFGKEAYGLLVSAPKSMIGHTIGGSGAIEFAATALALSSQKIPPTINYEFPDPECDLNYVPNSMLPVMDLEAAICNSFALGGHQCVIVLTTVP